jgi:hypothetical protein
MPRLPVFVSGDVFIVAVWYNPTIIVDKASFDLGGNAMPVTIHGCGKRSFVVFWTAKEAFAKRARMRLDIAR